MNSLMETTGRATSRQTLPGRYYTDVAWFNAEMDRVFAAMWIAVCRVDRIASRGQFVRRDVAGASVLIIGDGHGCARAFHNVCRHRGTRLCATDSGEFAGSIQCPYHAWTYDLEGRLIGAPLMDDVEGFRRDAHPLQRVACEVWDGHVFINMSAQPTPLAAQLGDLPERFAPWGMADLRMAHRVEYDVKANWKLIVQNYNECLHCPIIHPLLNRMHHYLGAANVPSTETYCGGAMGLRDGVDTLSIDGVRRRALLPGLTGGDRTRVNYFAIYPNFLLTLHPDYMLTITIWPEAPNRTRLVGEWHFHPDEIARPDFVFADAVEFWDVTNREDWAISERSQQGISSRGYQPGPYSNRETQLWEFDEFVLSRVQSQ
ncbi:MAG: aromatic ring-hydroxylating dioxygenase subunit alpha [Acidobacteria bacterium]|nr:aromatic ring-hydroxylating dioxygenase subunit alpha [Acidobacteriota bacterium]